MKNLPKFIYLQIGEDCDCDDFNEVCGVEEITWTEEAINDNDIKYKLVEEKMGHFCNRGHKHRTLKGRINCGWCKNIERKRRGKEVVLKLNPKDGDPNGHINWTATGNVRIYHECVKHQSSGGIVCTKEDALLIAEKIVEFLK